MNDNLTTVPALQELRTQINNAIDSYIVLANEARPKAELANAQQTISAFAEKLAEQTSNPVKTARLLGQSVDCNEPNVYLGTLTIRS